MGRSAMANRITFSNGWNFFDRNIKAAFLQKNAERPTLNV
jgi:hypothetical protein